MDQQESLQKLHALDPFWQGNKNGIWLATTLSLHRNVDKFTFPQRLETGRKKILTDLLFDTICSTSLLSNPTKMTYDSMEAIEREYLAEHFLEFEPMKDSLLGQAFLYDQTGSIFIKINVQDHLEIEAIETQGNLEQRFDTISTLEKEIENRIAFAFSTTFGYLTLDPTLCGTGLVVKAFLHVPALVETGELLPLIQESQNEGVQITGLHGSIEEILGDMIVVGNRWTLGINEASILSIVRTTALAIASREKAKREKIKAASRHNEAILDKLSRVIGTLKFCYTIDTSEALRDLSLVKLGVELGWLKGITIEELNWQFFALRRAHIASSLAKDTPRIEINHERARLFRSLFEKVELHTD